MPSTAPPPEPPPPPPEPAAAAAAAADDRDDRRPPSASTTPSTNETTTSESTTTSTDETTGAAGQHVKWTVKPGDTLSSIAAQFGTTVDELAAPQPEHRPGGAPGRSDADRALSSELEPGLRRAAGVAR